MQVVCILFYLYTSYIALASIAVPIQLAMSTLTSLGCAMDAKQGSSRVDPLDVPWGKQ